MNIEIKTLSGNLAIIVNKANIEVNDDKETLSLAVHAMCNLHCFDLRLTVDEINEFMGNNVSSIVFIAIKGSLYISKHTDGNTKHLMKYQWSEEE